MFVIFFKSCLFLFYVFDCFAYMFVCSPQKQEKGDRPSRTRVTDGYEQPRCWESKPGPLEGQPVLIATEPTLSPCLSHVLRVLSSPKREGPPINHLGLLSVMEATSFPSPLPLTSIVHVSVLQSEGLCKPWLPANKS